MILELGEVICDKCNGTGILNRSVRIITCKKPYTSTTSTESPILFNCTKCFGSGKLDWLENVLGKKEEKRPDHYNLDPFYEI